MTIWKLRSGADRRIRAQHPWVFSNELAESPKGLIPGSPVVLQDSKGHFVASGYGNPHSLISFRALSFDSSVQNPCEIEELVGKVISAWGHRNCVGFKLSFRLVYGEADWLPGLVIDRYVVEQNNHQYQVFCCQILTAGIQKALEKKEVFFRRIVEEAVASKLSPFDWSQTCVIVRNDVQIRKLEGLEVEEAIVLKKVENLNLNSIDILLPGTKIFTTSNFGKNGIAENEDQWVRMSCDLVHGQKTGFFLDQAQNIYLVCDLIRKSSVNSWGKPLRILDLCCYVGQWSTQLSRAFSDINIPVEVTAVDVSEQALKFAEKNISREAKHVLTQKKDVLEELSSFPDRHYDIVIADPPAFIKAKKDIPTGKHAYMKMNASAFRLVKRGGWVISCSCSGLLTESEFMEVIAKSIRRQNIEARCLSRGGHAADHPHLMSFPEGFYLKMFLHQTHF